MLNAQTFDASTILPSVFTDDRFRHTGRNRLFGEIDGTRVGVVLATRSQRFDNFALNKGDFDRLIAGLREGKIDQAYVVQARSNGFGAMVYAAYIKAEQLAEMLNGHPPMTSQLGPFWVLPPGFKMAGGIDEPF